MTGNDLLVEFAERCGSASRSIQNYIAADDPAPDPDTLLTLIETNDALAAALSRHQRAVLAARRHDDRMDRRETALDMPPNEVRTNGAGTALSEPYAPPEQTRGGTLGAVAPDPTQDQRNEPKPVAKKGPVPRLGFPRMPLRAFKRNSGASSDKNAAPPPPAPTTSLDSSNPPPILVPVEAADDPFDDRHRVPPPPTAGLSSARSGVNGNAKGPPPPLPLGAQRGMVHEGVLVGEDGAPLTTATGGLDLSPRQATHSSSPERQRNLAAGVDGQKGAAERTTERSIPESDEEADSPVQVRQYRF